MFGPIRENFTYAATCRISDVGEMGVVRSKVSLLLISASVYFRCYANTRIHVIGYSAPEEESRTGYVSVGMVHRSIFFPYTPLLPLRDVNALWFFSISALRAPISLTRLPVMPGVTVCQLPSLPDDLQSHTSPQDGYISGT